MTSPSITKTTLAKSRHETHKEFVDKIKSKIAIAGRSTLEAADFVYEWHKSGVWEDEYDTFVECCLKTLGFEKSHSYRLLNAGTMRLESKNSPIGEKLDNIKQFEAISKVPEADREKVLKEVEKIGAITEKAIKEVFKKLFPETEVDAEPVPDVLTDEMGYTLPEEIVEDWARAKKTAQEYLTALSEVRRGLEVGVEQGDRIYAEISQATIIDLRNNYTSVKLLMPYAVCTCEGFQKVKCKFCMGRGFLSKFRWDQTVPKEIKDAREKTASTRK